MVFTPSFSGADVATARACLLLHLSRAGQVSRDKGGIQQHLLASQAGVKALAWFLGTGKHEQVESIDLILINAMAFCVVGEGASHHWWDLLKIKHAPTIPCGTAVPDSHSVHLAAYKWKDVLSRSFLEAQAYWTTEANMYSEPLESYLHVMRDRVAYPNVSISASFHWLIDNLTCADKTGLDIEAHDEFIAHSTRYKLIKCANGLGIVGYLQLMHPTNPRAELLLRLFRDAENDAEKMEILQKKSLIGLKLMASRLAQHCYRTGDSTAADQVIDITLGVLGGKGQLANSGPHKQSHKTSRMRKATRVEIERGVPVDADGNVARHDLMHFRD